HTLAVWAALWSPLWASPDTLVPKGGKFLYDYNSILAELLTGVKEIDAKLYQAFELGIRHGSVDQNSIQRSARIDQTTRLLTALMRTQSIDLERAMACFCIPRKERDTYRRIITKRISRHKSAGTKP
uniref:hypothetical protein n=1 Tax=Acetatifactor sp. TaxID=1872090 RepID=UPI004055D3CD